MTNRNTSVEKAKFEVSNHKYTDLSETRYGIAVLNDCKYGISLEGSSMRLSLHKGGNVIVETIKPAEDTGRTYVLRMYEAEGAQTVAKLAFGLPVTEIEETNMLEETKNVLGAGWEISLTFKPFEIKILKISY